MYYAYMYHAYMYVLRVCGPMKYPSIQLLRNDLEVTKVDLSEILPAATIMVVSVTASTTQGFVYTYMYMYNVQ